MFIYLFILYKNCLRGTLTIAFPTQPRQTHNAISWPNRKYFSLQQSSNFRRKLEKKQKSLCKTKTFYFLEKQSFKKAWTLQKNA